MVNLFWGGRDKSLRVESPLYKMIFIAVKLHWACNGPWFSNQSWA